MAGRGDSALAVDGFAAIRSVGFEPVGQVFGAAVYYLATVAGIGCPGTTAASYQRQDCRRRCAAEGAGGSAGRLEQSLHEGRRTALDRMAAECARLGGHGVVGAVVRVTEIPATSLTAAAIEFTVMGTAVRVAGCPALARPFATELSGADFAKLVMGGWVPAGIALGIAVAGLHDRAGDDQLRPLGHRERGGAGLHRPDQRRAQRCARSSGAVGARAWG